MEAESLSETTSLEQ